jgi:SNF2 family DNA or RNA helicase
VVLEEETWVAYRKMAHELFLELKRGEVSDAKNVAVKIMRLQQITGGWIKSDEGNLHRLSTAKLRGCRERLEDLFDADERVVVFARFRPEVFAVAKLGDRFKVPTYRLLGGIRREERDEARRAFQAKDGPSLFVAQIQTGGLGITLHSSSQVIFYSVTYALDDYIQACDRVHRIGQKRKVTYQHLVATSTIDIDIYAALRQKQQLMNLIMDPRGRRRLMRSLARNLDIDE